MPGTKTKPVYGIYLYSGTTRYDLTPCVEALKFTDDEKQISKKLQIDLANVQVNGTWLNSIIRARDRIFVYADDGEKLDEVWRGFVWELGYKSTTSTRALILWAYDNLIYLQESEDSLFFEKGKSTKDVMISIANKWGIAIDYSYLSITHEKLVLRGNLADIITSDVLNKVREKEDKKYVILSEKDIMWVREVGQNKAVYQILGGNSATTTETKCTMNGMITRVVILGQADDNECSPVETSVDGDVSKYGTLQKVVNRGEKTSLEDVKKEANLTIKENGTPKWEYIVESPDVPWVRKGDKIHVNAGGLIGDYIIKGVVRDISNDKRTMRLTMEDVK